MKDSLLNFLLFSRQNKKKSNIQNMKTIRYMSVSVSNLFQMDKKKPKPKTTYLSEFKILIKQDLENFK